MQKVIFTILKFFLFFLTFLVGSFAPLPPPFHFERVLNTTPAGTHIFVGDGLYLMLLLYVVLALSEVLRKKLRSSVPWTTLAVLLAMGLGFLLKLGFKTV